MVRGRVTTGKVCMDIKHGQGKGPRGEEICYTIRSCKMVAKWKGKEDGFADHTGFT